MTDTARTLTALLELTPDNSAGLTSNQDLRDMLVSALDPRIVTVLQYGATRDGSTDDSAAFQAAIDAVGTAGGGSVHVPPGTYRLNTGLVLDTSNVRLVGAGVEVTRLNYYGSGKAVDVTAFLHTSVSGMRIDDTGGNGTHGYANNYAGSTTNFQHRAESLHISGFVTGFAATNIEQFWGSEIRVFNASGVGFAINNDDHSGSSNGISNVFIRCRAISCGGYGWDVDSQTSSTFIGCQGLSCATYQGFFGGGNLGLTIDGWDGEDDGTKETTCLSLSGSQHRVSFNAFNVNVGLAMSTCSRTVVFPSPSSTVNIAVLIDSASSSNTVFENGGTITDTGTNNAIIGPSYLPAQRLTGWVADDAQNPSIGTLPARSYVTNVVVQVTEAFNSDGDDEITVGYDAAVSAFATAVDVSTTGIKSVTMGTSEGYNGTARSVEAYYSPGGSAPSAGKALVILEYYRVPVEVD